MEEMQKNIYLTEKQVAKLLNLSPRTLQAWRKRGIGPPFVRFGRLVRYELGALQRWVSSQEVAPAAAAAQLAAVR